MKYLDVPELENLNKHINATDLGDRVLNARLEAYTCRPYKEDKRLLSEIYRQYDEPATRLNKSPLGSMAEPSTRKLLAQLISTLNQSFIDYDFSNASPDDFNRVSADDASLNINMNVLDPLEKEIADIKELFWNTLDDFIDVASCEIYRYQPKIEIEDVFTKGKLFSCNFFFINRRKRKLVFFAAAAVSVLHSTAYTDKYRTLDSMIDMEDGPCSEDCVPDSSEEDGCRISSSWIGNVTLVPDETPNGTTSKNSHHRSP